MSKGFFSNYINKRYLDRFYITNTPPLDSYDYSNNLKSNKDILDLVESHKRVWKRDISKKVGKMSKSYILAQKSTKLINIKTGEEWQFESLTETAKFLQSLTPPYKAAPGTLSYVINKGTIYKGTFKLMYLND